VGGTPLERLDDLRRGGLGESERPDEVLEEAFAA
jgi:hypothetical protein